MPKNWNHEITRIKTNSESRIYAKKDRELYKKSKLKTKEIMPV